MTDDLTFPLARSAQMAKSDPKAAKETFHEAAAAAATPCPSCGKVIIHRKGLQWCEDHQMTEKNLQDRVRARAKKRGWTVAHAGRGYVGEAGGWITPMLPGWPDFFLLNPACKAYQAFWLEFKREEGVVSEEQEAVHALLRACGIKGTVIRPSDLRSGAVNAILEGR